MTSLRSLTVERVRQVLREGGLAIDLRPADAYLDHHVPASIPLLFEAGPGLGSRARDLLPLDAPLILLEDGASDLDRAADSFRGKGFEVVGYRPGGVDSWPGEPTATPQTTLADAAPDLPLLHVADPGTLVPVERGTLLTIPAERLWDRAGDLDRVSALGILAGWGVRAASAVGILEKLGFTKLTFVRTRPVGERPPMADAQVFRAGGPP
jgi:rhodanese-related sulfurtransferase